jgi:hypothetical protein
MCDDSRQQRYGPAKLAAEIEIGARRQAGLTRRVVALGAWQEYNPTMARVTGAGALLGIIGLSLIGAVRGEEPEGLFERFRTHMKSEWARLPECVCSQTIERLSRTTGDQPWQKLDTLKLDVALAGDAELYGRAGAPQFYRQALSDVVKTGVVSTGKFGLFARQIVDIAAAKYHYRGLGERDGRPAHEYDFDVGAESSNYILRSGAVEAAVAYQGSFWIDAETLDLRRLEAQAYDIPERLGLAEARTTLDYARITLDDSTILAPVSTVVEIVTVEGPENLNRVRTTGCRRFQSQSSIRFAGEAAPAQKEQRAEEIPAGLTVELQLAGAIDPERAEVGQAVSAKLTKEIRDGARIVAAEGSLVDGEIVNIEKRTNPFPVYEISVEFNAVRTGGRVLAFSATMEDAGPSSGLLRQMKRMEPTFSPRRTARMNIMVRKVQRGHGTLYWDARHGDIPRGLRMKWRVLAGGEQ